MEIVLVIVGIVALLFIMSIGGWIMKGLAALAGLFFEGVGNCLGCILKFGVWIFVVWLLFMLIFC